ncbi:MAG: MFS transporter [Candidatus Brockarchaeota archaeon]|nr:MFS transporter [Candidatus Brockarchaeota archaeon]
MKHGRLRVLIYVGWTHSLNHGLFVSITPLIPMIASEGYDYLSIGLLLSVYLLLYSFGSLLSAPLLRRVEDRKILFTSLMLQGLSTFFLLMPGLTGLSLFILFSGVFASLYHPVSNVFIFNRFRENVNFAMGLHGTGGNLAQFVFPLFSFLMAVSLGWRMALISTGFMVFLSSIPYLATPRVEKNVSETGGDLRGFIKVVSQKSLIILIFFSLLFGLYYRGIEVFLPTYLNSEKGFSGEAGSTALSILLLAGALGQYLGGVVGERLNEETALLLASALELGSLILLQTVSSPMLVMLSTALLGFAFYSHQPAANSLLGKKSMEELRAYSYSVWFFLGFISSSPSTLTVSLIGQKFGFTTAILVLSMIAILPLALAIHIYLETRKHGGSGDKTRL